MFIVEKTKGKLASLPAREIDSFEAKHLSSPLAKKILLELAKKPAYAMEIAKKLKIHEQKVYYHIRKLEKARIIEVARTGVVEGAQANYYKLVQPAFVIRFKDFQETQRIAGMEEQPSSFLEPFIEDGQLNCQIIVGSPDPHGPEKARSRDGYYAVDLALFLGTFLNFMPDLNVKLDTEARTEDLQKNLILVGGPIINTVTAKINSRLPVRFDSKSNWDVVSRVSGKTYPTDETGIIVKIKNPFNPKKQILLIAGKRYAGTKAVMIAFIKHFNKIVSGNMHNPKIPAKVVEGVDLDADGIVDDAEILE
jgi:DNA-binding transcriptional ArsR family regulator